MLNIIETKDGEYEVSFRYQPYLVEAIKKIPGASYRGQHKHWVVPPSSRNALFNWASLLGWKPETIQPKDYTIPPLPELEIEIPLKRELFKYQTKGVAYSLKKKRVIIGDEPGLGKTGQAIASVEGAGCKCVLVICPNTLTPNWKAEVEAWTNSKAMIMSDKVKATWPTYYQVGMIKYFIVNYEGLKKYFVQEIQVHYDKRGEKVPLRLNHIIFRETINLFDAVIVDESHRCRNGKTQWTKFTMGICRNKDYRLLLTGTPVVNTPMDLFPQLYILGREQDFGGYKGFINRFCQGPNKASNLSELNYLLNSTCFYRRLKKDVLQDLPDKVRNLIRVDLTNQTDYNKAENNFINYLRENLKKSEGEITTALRGETMVQIGILKQVAARGKVEAVLEHIKDINDAGEKMVVFAWHTEIVNALKDQLPGALTIVGSDSMDDRERAKHLFQECKKCHKKFEIHNEDHAFQPSDHLNIILNIKSGGVGLTLTAASRVSFIELPWTAADSDQCEDRCHRISQKDSVQANYFLGRGTIDEYLYKIIEKKRGIATGIVGDDNEIQVNIVDEFINLFTAAKF